MFRLVFPEISFKGRLSRGAFWKELAVAAFMAPFLIGILAHLISGIAEVSTQGLQVSGSLAKFTVAFMLTGLAGRNIFAFAGMVKRRLNDIGDGDTDLRQSSMPILVTIVGGILAINVLPLQFSIFVLVFLFWSIVIQLKRIVSFGYKLVFYPSEKRGFDGFSGAENAVELSGQGMATTALKDSAMNIGELIKDLAKRSANGQKAPVSWDEIRTAASKSGVTEQFDKLRQWLNEPVVDGNSRRATTKRTKSIRQSEPRRETRETKLRPAKPEKTKTEFLTPSSSPVKASRRLPKQGRSSMWSGLFAGPWG